MEDDLNESSSSMIPVALAVLAIALGGAGLYFGMTANQRLNPISENMEASSGSSARIEKQLAAFDTKLAELAAKSDELTQTVGRLRVYSSQSEQGVKRALSDAKSNREEIVKLVEKFNELAATSVRPQAAAAAVATSVTNTSSSSVSVTSDDTSSAPSTAPGVYLIESGDNFAKVASKLGISLQTLLDANPGVNPRALQIGQKINVPAR